MTNLRRLMPAILLVLTALHAPTRGAEPVTATVESTMATRGDQIRQLILDGDESTFFASEKATTAEDHLTIVLDRPVTLKSIVAKTGQPDGTEKVDGGALE